MGTFADSSLIRRPQPYGWAWVVGLGLHLLLALAVVIVALWPSSPRIDLSQKPITAKLVRQGKPRDERFLPRKETAPPPPPSAAKPAPVPAPPKPAPAAEAKAAPSPAPAPAAAPQKPDDRKQKLDDIMKRFKATAAAGAAEDPVGALDGDPDGDAENAEEGERYLALVKKRIQDRYEVPATISDQERVSLRAVVRIYVQRNGAIARSEIVQPSQNPVFDQALEAAIGKVRTLPPPPEHLAADLSREGIDVVFRASGS